MVAGGQTRVATAYFWGPILESAIAHKTTAEMWSRISEIAQQQGLSFGPQVLLEVNALRANAGQLVRASERLSAASTPTTILAEHIGRPFYARPPAEQEARPLYEVRFLLDALTPTGVVSMPYRIRFGADLPRTVAELRDEVQLHAAEYAGAYGHELIGIGPLMLNVL